MSKKIVVIPGLFLIVMLGIVSCQFSTIQNGYDRNSQTQSNDIPTLNYLEKASIQASIESSVQSTRIAMGYRPVPEMVDEAGWQLRQYPMKEMIKRETYDAQDSAAKVPNLTVASSYDDHISQEEIVETVVAIEEAKKEIGNVIYMYGIYYDAYGAFADEGITILNQNEVELQNIYDRLNELRNLLYQGEDVLNYDQAPLISAAIELKVQIDMAKENCASNFEQYDDLLNEWEKEWLAISPDVVISEPLQIFDLLDEYVDTIFKVTEDENVDHDEIEELLHAAVNARYAIETYGNEDIQSTGESITKMIGWIVDGDGNQIQYGIKNFMIYSFLKENYQ